VPPSLGYNRFYSWVKRRYLGIRRADLTAFLNSQEGRQKYRRLFKPSKARVVTSKAPGIRWIMDIKFLPEVRLRNKFFVGVAVIIDAFSKLLFTSMGDFSERLCIISTLTENDTQAFLAGELTFPAPLASQGRKLACTHGQGA
jgi:hypothetical protein